MRALMAPNGLVHVPLLFFCQVCSVAYDVLQDDDVTMRTWVESPTESWVGTTSAASADPAGSARATRVTNSQHMNMRARCVFDMTPS